MKLLSKTASLLMLISLMSTVLGARLDTKRVIYLADEEKSPPGAAVSSAKQTPGVCGTRPYDYLFDESRQRSILRNVVDDLKTQTDPNNIKIVGGNTAVHGEFPWQGRIQLLYRNGDNCVYHQCGAVVISEHWLLSAAHCFVGFENYDARIFVGDHELKVKDDGEQEFDAERIITHENYVGDVTEQNPCYTTSVWRSRNMDKHIPTFGTHIEGVLHDNDIALIKIRPTSDGRGIQFNDFVQPACLPDSRTRFTEGTDCLISGWGFIKQVIPHGPPVLQLSPILLLGAKVPLIHQTVCKHMYSVSTHKRNVTERMICAGYVDGGVDTCHGDSGGPLVSKTEGFYTLYGLTSWGLGCAAPKLPGVYARVSEFLPWIKSNINAYSENIEQGTLPSKPSMNQDDESSEEYM